MKKTFAIILASLSMLGVHGQEKMSFFNFEDKWNEYQLKESEKPRFLHRIFKDSVSVEEMKEAFLKYKDVPKNKRKSDVEYDTVALVMSPYSVMIESPQRRHPQKEVRECRAVWHFSNSKRLIGDLIDKNGESRKDLVEQLNKDYSTWLDGDMVTLNSIQWYMGFMVSPQASLRIYDKGEIVCGEYVSSLPESDFFSFASESNYMLMDYPDWTIRLNDGARLLGVLHNMQSNPYLHRFERTFSVLLHSNLPGNVDKKAYTIELLEPKDADGETMRQFKEFKEFVERIPKGAFKPYYTTDFRIMTGRYYRVTVNKCGWLVEDYFSIN
ncbi:MAG: DUF5030 domain-containing protein [Bacteroides sp.]|nr:DUF5030 domain-containing protein [Bacteroides sp.]MCM1447725.1 DUF5030 domain-containing protein [Bacteroides sp.]